MEAAIGSKGTYGASIVPVLFSLMDRVCMRFQQTILDISLRKAKKIRTNRENENRNRFLPDIAKFLHHLMILFLYVHTNDSSNCH